MPEKKEPFNQQQYVTKYNKENYASLSTKLKKDFVEDFKAQLDKDKLSYTEFLRNAIKKYMKKATSVLKLQPTKHNYSPPYNQNASFDTWEDFKQSEFANMDINVAYCIHFNINYNLDADGNKTKGNCNLELFFIMQSDNSIKKLTVKEIIRENMKEIDAYLKNCWSNIQNQWQGFI